MKTLNLAILSLASVILFSCKGKNDKPIDKAPDTNASLIDEDNNAVIDDNTSGSNTATYTDNVDGTVDNINSGTGAGNMGDNMNSNKSEMYKKLDMTDDQIQKYEAASKKHEETIKNNKDIKKNAGMQQRDDDMKAVLSTSQYTKYRDMVKDYYKDQDSTQTKKQ